MFAGHDLTSQLEVDYAPARFGRSGSTVNIDSRVSVKTPGVTSEVTDVSIAATNVNVRAPVASQDAIRVAAETLVVDAAVGAPNRYDMFIGNDAGNDAGGGTRRGRLQLSASGSLSGALSPTPGSVSTPTGIINVIATQADVFAESVVYGTKQDWLLQSTKDATDLAPYVFATRSGLTSVETGLIRGGTVAILLANDAPTPLDVSIASNTIDLNTQIDSLRVKAASRQIAGAPADPSASGPFPYELTIREADDISIDAVAASGLPLGIESGGSMRFNTALATAGDVSLRAQSSSASPARLTVSAPLSTTKGRILLEADSVTLGNSVLVTDADEDEVRDDIVIRANAGDVRVAGVVSAVNRVRIEQANALGPTESVYQAATVVPIPNPGTVTQSIQVTDDFVFDDLDVEIAITHPLVGELSGTLIAPDGRRFRLFSRVGGTGDNFTGTIFDSEAVDGSGNPRLISQGTPPFTGRFRPVDSLAVLYRTSALGTWRLEINDAAALNGGTLNSFALRFQATQAQAGKVFGSARVIADALVLDVEGAVGNAALLPTDVNFYLRTDVNTIVGTVGGDASFDELGDVHVPSLQAGGFVSLRAGGVDPASGANAGRRALTASLVDIAGLDVSAPNGSIDVLFDTSRKIEVGNARALRTGASVNSLAAGDVTIRSTAGSLIVLDAPVAGGNARAVRVATRGDLATANNGQTLSLVSYAAGNPGVVASTLRGRGDLNAWFGVEVQPLRVGERVLVKNQANPAQNGVYALTFMSTAAWTTATTWTLTRAADSDTAAEFAANTFVMVAERQAGGVDQTGTWQIAANYVPLNGQTKPGATYAASTPTVTVAGTSDLRVGMAVFGPGVAVGATVAGIVNGTTFTLSQATTTASPVGGATLKFVEPTVVRSGTTTTGGLDDVLLTGLAATADLRVGMLVVGSGIPNDTVITRILNGTTVVMSKGATAAGPRPLTFITPFATRNANTSAGSTSVTGLVTTGDLREGMVVVGPGIPADTTIAAIVNGNGLTLSRAATAAQSRAGLKFLAATPTNFGLTPIAVTRKAVITDIGSDDPGDTVTFVVSTNAGTNSAAGSLGKMMTLRQQNSAMLGGDPATGLPQPMDLSFSAAVATNLTPIRLTQELPEITRAFSIDGGQRYAAAGVPGSATPPLIDGSRITQTRTGRAVMPADLVSGFVVSGPAASGTVIRNVNVAGFNRTVASGLTTLQSAAIDVRDAAGVLVSNVTLGVSEVGVRLANGVGVRFSGVGSSSGSLLNSNVFGSSASGLSVENGAGRVTVVGTTFGKAGMENAVGATFGSGVNQFGVDPVAPVQPIPQVQATRTAANSFTLPANWPSAWRLVPTMEVLGTIVIPTSGSVRATISRVTTNAQTGVTTVTLAGGTVTASGTVTFVAADPASIPDAAATRVNGSSNQFTLSAASRNVSALLSPGLPLTGSSIRAAGPTPATISAISRNLATGVTTVTITGGTITGNGTVRFGNIVYTEVNATSLALPTSVNMDNLFLGQGVSGTGIAAGTVITAIDRTTRTVRFADDKRMTLTGFAAISFQAGGRNVVTQNRTGLVLAAGATTVANSSITANTFNGIEVRGSGATVGGQTMHHRIGSRLAPAATSNQINSNGGWGVYFTPAANAVKNNVAIQGNHLGTTGLAVVSSTLSNRKGNIGHFTTREEAFAGLSSRLVPRGIDGLDAANNQHGRYTVSGGGSSAGTGGVR